ncbi:Lysine/ornithine decarboxylase [Ensifer sp. M14]|nr:Lysine/ornithine decarboxylase [Ensifer sp. M14]
MPEVRLGYPLQSMADKAELKPRRASVHRSRIERMLGSGVSTGWFQSIRAYALCPPRKRSILDQGNKAMTTARIIDFINTRRPDGPCLVVDLDVVRNNFKAFRHAMPDSSIYYAVKANPAPEILRLLAGMGSSFDCASVAEIEMALDAGATASRISYGNTIKKERDIARAHALGVSLFAVDSHEEVEKVARAAPGARVFCRVLTDGEGAEWPLSRKFGCVPQMAVDVLVYAHQHGLVSYGVSFHVGSQMTKLDAWDQALADAKRVFVQLAKQGIELKMVNMGGGFPTKYLKDVPTAEAYGQAIFGALKKHFGNHIPETIIEPGRGMVGNAGVIKAEVVLVSKKSDNDAHRWVFLDIGKFGGLAETMDEAIRYPIRTARDGDEMEPCVLAGPTCDSADVLYEKNMYPLPITLSIGDEVLIEGTGAYTTTYSAVAFNGFEPLKSYVI